MAKEAWVEVMIMRIADGEVIPLEDAYDRVAISWELSPAERAALRGDMLVPGDRCGRARGDGPSAFAVERMALVVDIDWLLRCRMADWEVRLWLRRRLDHALAASPLQLMFGSTDRLREIRAMLAADVAQ